MYMTAIIYILSYSTRKQKVKKIDEGIENLKSNYNTNRDNNTLKKSHSRCQEQT